MGLREDIEREDKRAQLEFQREFERCPDGEIDAVLFRISEASKERQRAPFTKHRYAEPVILGFPGRDPPRAA